MGKKQESTWNLELLTDTEIYAAIRDLDADPGSANKQLPQLTDREICAVIRYLDPDSGGANDQDHPTDFVICVILVILGLGCSSYLWL